MDNTGTQTPQPPISGPLPHRPVFQPAAPAGDIILTPDATTKKTKKPWIIGGVLGIAVLAIIILLAILIPILSKQHNISSAKAKFNLYANYMLYASDSDADIEGTYNYGETYWLANIKLTEDQITDHFTKSKEKFTDFYNVYQKNADEYDQETQDLVNGYLEQLEAFEYATESPLVDFSTLLESFVTTPDSLKNKVTEYYANYESAMSEEVRKSGQEYLTKSLAVIDAFEEYSRNSCIDKNNLIILDRCINDTKFESEKTALDNFQETSRKYLLTENRTHIGPYQNIWKISRGLAK